MAEQLTAEKGKADKKIETAEEVRERDILNAVERVYRTYGSDLSAFQRDVEKQLLKLSEARSGSAA